ncbi:hypothetical protein BC832DRAFT_549502 [Gaertneriomyces semiglobifer]|nr:hypothetical protein BC832DRAFT_549502 [Gaertneriomyces semiglobifer]
MPMHFPKQLVSFPHGRFFVVILLIGHWVIDIHIFPDCGKIRPQIERSPPNPIPLSASATFYKATAFNR